VAKIRYFHDTAKRKNVKKLKTKNTGEGKTAIIGKGAKEKREKFAS